MEGEDGRKRKGESEGMKGFKNMEEETAQLSAGLLDLQRGAVRVEKQKKIFERGEKC